MLVASAPTRIPLIWASAAGGAYIHPIPTASQISVTNGAASFTDGFPPLCFVPYATGGAGPFGADFNGALNQITAGLQWGQAGGPYYFNSGFSTQIGGYPEGAVIPSATLGGLWQSTVDNNTTNPDTGGINWRALLLPTSMNVAAFVTSTSFTVPQGVYWVTAIITGGGGGGAGATTNQQGGCGGAGGTFIAFCSVTPGTIISIPVGTGGAAAGPNATGGSGGTSSFGSYASATGGTGGVNSNTVVPGGTGGIGIAGSATGVPIIGGGGSDGLASSSFFIGQGLGGASFWGGGLRQGSGGGVSGPAWGSGGGGAYNNAGIGGNGQSGIVVVVW